MSQNNNKELLEIVFIGPEGKSTWIGTEEGLLNDCPYARIIKNKPFKGFNINEK